MKLNNVDFISISNLLIYIFFYFKTDIAVGAPYEDNGVVYIYMGSQNGITSTPSQRIVAPTNDLFNPSTLSAIFGHGLSKGVDIDNNNYVGE